MKRPIIYALDFDGVICDSVLETGISAWKAAAQIWDDIPTGFASVEQLAQFRQIRPFMGTGYEAILIVRLLSNGESVDDIMGDYHAKIQKVIKDSGLTIDALKKLFGETRDRWIEEDLEEWIAMNPLFPGVAKKLKALSEKNIWYIITTKQERFVKEIFKANQVELPEERIFGLDRKMSKEEVLIDLANQHTEAEFYFVEDMLPSLLKIIKSTRLESVKLFLALWGYNTAEDKLAAEKYNIELINVKEFLI